MIRKCKVVICQIFQAYLGHAATVHSDSVAKLQEEASCVLACGVVRVEGACDLMVDFRM
jgi:hypothetical protein